MSHRVLSKRKRRGEPSAFKLYPFSLHPQDGYSITTALLSYGNDDYQEMLYGGIPEEDQQAFHSAVADDRRNLRIETTDGICFFIAFYPNYNWIYGTGALSYYQINEAMHDWINRNLND